VPGDVSGTLLAVGLGAARTVPVTWLVSPLGGARLPALGRVAFGLLLAALAAPALGAAAARAGLAHAGGGVLLLVLARELLVGFGLGLVVSFAFRAAEVAGRLVDVLRGAALAEVLVPTSEERGSPLSALYGLLAALVFLELGGVPRLLEALLASYGAVPLGGGLPPATSRSAWWRAWRRRCRCTSSGSPPRACWPWASSCWGWGRSTTRSRPSCRRGWSSAAAGSRPGLKARSKRLFRGRSSGRDVTRC
jgi:type III secretory pathway component EscT